ncbi:MAG: isoprenylcysteine carboxylmethyltransferase family protein [Anaerolineales bacterium]|nr:isoprenylcysteine carboxylmethyltransferase family protein [Anaerolineales bacterium]
MKQKTLETLGYIINGVSIALFFYLAFTLEMPDSFQPLRIFGWIILGMGIALVVLSIVALSKNKSAGLIERGIYGVIRHPMYLGAMLCFLSYYFFLTHWAVILLSLINIAIIYVFILQGDQQNIEKFGDAYKRYMETVPRINLLAGLFRYLRSE